MAVSDVDNDVQHFTQLVQNRQKFWAQVQEDLKAIYTTIQQQLRVATVSHLHWNHMRAEEIYVLAAPASRIIRTTKLLRTALITREKIARLATRYVMTSLLYRERAWFGDRGVPIPTTNLEVEALQVIKLMEDHGKIFDQDIKEMDKEIDQDEKEYRNGPCSTSSEHVNALFRRAFDTLTSADKDKSDQQIAEIKDKIEQQSAELARLKETMAKQAKMGAEKIVTQEMEEIVEPIERNGDDCGTKATEEELNDGAYMQRLIEEISDTEKVPALITEDSESTHEEDNMQQEAGERTHQDGVVCRVADDRQAGSGEARILTGTNAQHNQDRNSGGKNELEKDLRKMREQEDELRKHIDHLQEDFDRMKADLDSFPYRKKEFQSLRMHPYLKCAFCNTMGQHFSDSCPKVLKGNRRYEIIRDQGLCPFCMEDCAPPQYPYKKRRCYYCSGIQGTAFEDLTPGDAGHHTALCNVPDKKELARARVESMDLRLRDLMGQLARLTAARNKKERTAEADRKAKEFAAGSDAKSSREFDRCL